MAQYRSHSVEFKRQIAQAYLSGETLHGLAKQHDLSRNLVRYLLHEAGGAPAPGRERSMPASKRFHHHRRRVGVDDRPDGQRISRTTFHSLRRWFITRARAGFDLAVVQAVVGHKPDNITDAVYSGGPDDDAKRRCVESVRLPSPQQARAESGSL